MFKFLCKTFSESTSCDVTVCLGLVGLEVICLFLLLSQTPVNTQQSAMEDAVEALLRRYWVSRLPLCFKILCLGFVSKCVVVESLSWVQLFVA